MFYVKLLVLVIVQQHLYASDIFLSQNSESCHYKKLFISNEWVTNVNCSKDDLSIELKIYDDESLEIICLEGEQNTEIFDLLPQINRIDLKLVIENCPLPRHFSTVTKKISEITFLVLAPGIKSLKHDFFDKESRLVNLTLWGNDFTELPTEVFKNLKLLERIDLGANEFYQLPDNLFEHNVNLRHFKLDNNFGHFSVTSFLSNNPALRTVSLVRNKIEQLPVWLFYNSENIEEINLSYNYIKQLNR